MCDRSASERITSEPATAAHSLPGGASKDTSIVINWVCIAGAQLAWLTELTGVDFVLFFSF